MKLTRLWLFGIAFSWFMTFAAWRFAHPIEIVADWVLVALVMTSVFLLKIYQNKQKRSITSLEQYR